MTQLKIILVLFFVAFAKKNPEASMKFMDICRYHGYLVEEHFVTTEDGYINRYS